MFARSIFWIDTLSKFCELRMKNKDNPSRIRILGLIPYSHLGTQLYPSQVIFVIHIRYTL